MSEFLSFDDICRLCLTDKNIETSLMLFEITESNRINFEELTQNDVNHLKLGFKNYLFMNNINCSFP